MFELKIAFKTLDELRDFIPFIGANAKVNEVESEGAAIAEAEAAAESSAPEKPVARKAKSSKRDAHQKLQAAVAKPAVDPTAAPADTTPAAATPTASAAPSVVDNSALPSKREIEIALRKFVAEKGMPAAREVLAEFSLTRVADLQESQFTAFYARLTGK